MRLHAAIHPASLPASIIKQIGNRWVDSYVMLPGIDLALGGSARAAAGEITGECHSVRLACANAGLVGSS